MVRVLWGGKSIGSGVSHGKECHGDIVLRDIEFLDQCVPLEECDPAATQSLFCGLQHDMGSDDGGIYVADGLALGIDPAGLLVVANHEGQGGAELAGGGLPNLRQDRGVVHQKNPLGLLVAAGGRQGGRLQEGIHLFRLHKTIQELSDGKTLRGQGKKIHTKK